MFASLLTGEEMTPLASLVFEGVITGRGEHFPQILSPALRCFEVTDIRDLAFQLAFQNEWEWASGEDRATFSPAPLSWIELVNSNGCLQAFLLEDRPDKQASTVWPDKTGLLTNVRLITCFSLTDEGVSVHDTFTACNYDGRGKVFVPQDWRDEDRVRCMAWARFCSALCSVINTPKISNHVKHVPSEKLKRKFTRANKGHPMPRWTKVTLDVAAPKVTRTASEREDEVLSGRALHLCRSFIRIRQGKLERVRSHWRGDPAFGVVRADYEVKA